MGWLNLSNMVCIRSYEEAHRVWTAQNARRPRSSKWAAHSVPLDGWRKPHVTLERHAAPGDDHHYACCLYDIPLVKYSPRGVQVVPDPRRGSLDFLRKTLPPGLRVERIRGRGWTVADTPDGEFYTPGWAQFVPPPSPTATGKLWLPTHTSERKVAVLQYRHVSRIERETQGLREWLAHVRRLGGHRVTQRSFLDHPSPGLLEAVHDQSRWGEFLDSPAEYIVSNVAVASGVLQIYPTTSRPAPPPNFYWQRRLPILSTHSELRLI